MERKGLKIRRGLFLWGTVITVLLITFFLPTASQSQIIYVDIFGIYTPVVVNDDLILLPKQFANLFGPSTAYSADGYWDCSCTFNRKDSCSGTCDVYHGGTLVNSYPSSCIGGIDQEGRSCKGCCFRIECTWVQTSSPPTIALNKNCTSWGTNGWCALGASVSVFVNEPQNDPLNVTCSNPSASASGNKTIALPDGIGAIGCTVSSANGSDSASTSWKVDTTAPSSSMSQSGTVGSNGWYRSNVSVSVSGSDATSGVASRKVNVGGTWYNNSTAVSTNGTNAVSYQVTDNAGNVSSGSAVIKIDKVAPSLSPSVNCTIGDNSWCISYPSINVGGSDLHSGISTQQVNVSGIGWQSSGYTLSQDGSFSLSYEVVDVAGNSGTGSGSVKVDVTKPVLSANASGTSGANGWFVGPVIVDASGSDATSGLASVGIQVNGGFWASSPAGLNADGIHNVVSRSVDQAGNMNQQNDQIKIDMTAPGLTSSVNGTTGNNGWFISAVTASISGTDVTSGVDTEEINVDERGWKSGSQSIFSDGEHSIKFRVTDMAGNLSKDSTSIKIDTTPPLIPMDISGTLGNHGWHISNVEIECNSSDGVSGLASEEIIGAGSPSNTVTIEGSSVHTCTAEDQAGNSNSETTMLKIDKTDPGMAPSFSGTKGTQGWYTSSVTVSVNGYDTVSGVDIEQIKIQDSSWGESKQTISNDGVYSISYQVVDNAGRSSSSIDTVKIDTISPSLSPKASGQTGGGYYGTAVTILVNASDIGSGVDAEYVRIDGGNWIAPGTYQLSDGNHKIEYLGIDNAGNRATSSETITVDGTAPSVFLNLPNTCSGEVTFSGTASDSFTLTSIQIVVDGNEKDVSLSGEHWSYTIKLSDGYHDVAVKAVDSAGNISTSSSKSFYSDSTAPVISLESTWLYWAVGSLNIKDNSEFEVTITGEGPNYSNKESYKEKNYPRTIYWRTAFGRSIWGNAGDVARVIVVAEDVCGNKTKKIANINVEKPEPTVTPTPTVLPTLAPKPTNTLKPTEHSRQGNIIWPTPIIEIVMEGPVDEIIEPFEFFSLPLWLWFLLTSMAILGVGGVFWDPRPKQIRRRNKIKEISISLDLFDD